MIRIKKSILVINLLFFVSFTSAQVRVNDYVSFNSQNHKDYFETELNSNNILTFRNGAEPELKTIDLNEKFDIIIEFKEIPYLIQKQSDIDVDEITYVNRFSQFRIKFAEMQQQQLNKSSKTQPEAIKIKKEFYKLFFGVSAIVNRGMLSEINKLDYVKKLHYNRKMESYLEKGISIIRADSVWNQFGVDGDSIIIAIIDTGIDYLHPALGGGFGPGYKVIGGYDFVSNDNDPMDDYGHGTHVAGIAAADGDSIKGVAPKASLIALKVLDVNGYGQEEDVIAAIEYCADPNGDGNTDDMVDIMNLSLGSSSGSPDAPSSVAIDNASSLGITACIAAGNNFAYQSIGTPGTAKSAITVGASNDEDKLALFSSKGPTNKTYSIKPDVVAPGVDINSLKLGGGFEEHSGTSMATPFVAGVCALLKSIHPEWGPKEFKSALITTSFDIGEDIMAQGAGRIDALGAAKVSTTFSPSYLSFGLDNSEELNWVVADTITISNHSNDTQTYSFQKDFSYPGVNVEFYPSSITLNAKEETSIIAEISIDNTVVPYPDWASLSYDGNILITGNENLHIPFAFVKASKLILTTDSPMPWGVVFGPNVSKSVDFIDDMYELEIILPPNTYDVLCSLPGFASEKIITVENIELDDYKRVNLKFSEAKNRIIYSGVDENGIPFDESRKDFDILPPPISPFESAGYSFPYDTLFLSDISDRYQLSFSEYSNKENQLKAVHLSAQKGISENQILTNNPNDYISRKLRMYTTGEDADVSIFSVGIRHDQTLNTSGTQIQKFENTPGLWEGELLLSPFNNDFYTSTIRTVVYSEPEGIQYLTPPFIIWNNTIVPSYEINPSKDILLTNMETPLIFGKSPVYCRAYIYTNIVAQYNIIANLFILGANNEQFPYTQKESSFKIYNKQNNIVFSDTNNSFIRTNLPDAYYSIEFIANNYSVQGLRGRLKLKTDFDLSSSDRTPPQITSFKLLDQSRQLRDHYVKDDSIFAYFSSADFQHLLSDSTFKIKYETIDTLKTKILSKLNGTNDWVELQKTIVLEDSTIGFLYSSDLSAYAELDSASIDLQLQFEDLAGNKSHWTISPAFTVGKIPIISNIKEVTNKDVLEPLSCSLSQNYPNPFNPTTTIKYTIPQFPLLGGDGRGGLVTLKIYDILGREAATLVNKQQQPGNYEVQFDADNLTSGIYFYILKFGAFSESKKMILLK